MSDDELSVFLRDIDNIIVTLSGPCDVSTLPTRPSQISYEGANDEPPAMEDDDVSK